MPPLLCFNWADSEGFEIVDRANHYGKRAQGGTGLIIVEATAIAQDGRICNMQLGLWRDEHIDQFERIAKSCHKENTVVLVQLVHAGMKSDTDIVYSSSAVNIDGKECLEMSTDMIDRIEEDFVSAAIRAKKAGLDGIEIHGAHGYLLSQFTSKEVNNRHDKYGGNLDNRLRLSIEIFEEIRKATGDDFIIGYRLGVNDLSMIEDKYFAKKLEDIGVDMLNVSSGIGAYGPIVDEDHKLTDITYMGVSIAEEVNIPVACVCGIREPKQAEHLLDNNMIDLVAVGRGLLADPDWTNKAINGDDIDICYHCKPSCKYIIDGRKCPRY